MNAMHPMKANAKPTGITPWSSPALFQIAQAVACQLDSLGDSDRDQDMAAYLRMVTDLVEEADTALANADWFEQSTTEFVNYGCRS